MEELFPFPMYESRGYPLIVQCIGHSSWHGPHSISRRDSEMCAIEFIHDGSGTLVENGRSFRLAKNDVFILHHGSDHTYSITKDERLEKTWITVRGPFLTNLLHLYGMGDTYHLSGCGDTAALFSNLYATGKAAYKKYRHTQRIAFDAALILHEVINKIARRNRAWEHTYHTDTAQMMQYIDDNIGREITLAKLAAVGGYSVSQAVRRFRRDTGLTPYGYALMRRIETAKFYLTETTMSISRIAGRLGFDDEHYFSKAFKKRIGMTPSDFRLRSVSAPPAL
ncbi:MAG: helix-turn-helix transcriptional regulator [Spirochaetes bacterium]|nr:helix-turn-helix transcriptional regulator [Spirochaetota bacterium]